MPVTLVANAKKTYLPAVFSKQMSIHSDFSSLSEVAERVTFHSQILVSITPDAQFPVGMLGQQGSMPGSQSSSGMPSMPGGLPQTPSQMPIPGQMSGQGFGGQASSMQQIVHLDFDGKVEDFLNLAASRYGVSWRYSDGRIEIYRTITKTFVIKSVPGSKTMSNSISSSGGAGAAPAGGVAGGTAGGAPGAAGAAGGASGASSGGAGPLTMTESSLSIWNDIEKTLATMKSASGKVFVNQSTGTVTITDIPSYLSQMEQYIDQQNAIMSKQVMLSIRIMSVSVNNADNHALNMGAVFASLSKNYGWAYSSAFATDPSASSLTMRVLNTAGASNPNANIGTLAGTNAIVSALRSEGNVTTLTSWSGTTMNNQPAPISVGLNSAYLQSTATTTTANVGTSTTLTPGSYITGISMSVMPHILDGGELILEYSLNIAALNNLFTQSSNGNTIQFPEIASRQLLNSLLMRSGQTLILSGFDQNTATIKNQDTGADVGLLAGGSRAANRNKDTLIILITAITADKL